MDRGTYVGDARTLRHDTQRNVIRLHPETSTGSWTAAGSRADLPDGRKRTILRPVGVHGVYCNGIGVFEGADYPANGHGPHQIQH